MPFKDKDGNISSIQVPMSIIKDDVPVIMEKYNIGMHGYDENKEGQPYLPNIFDQVDMAIKWLNTKLPTNSVSSNSIYSYSAKHMAEYWSTKFTNGDSYKYVSNGAMIIASIILGFPVKRDKKTSCAYIGISKKTLNYEDDGFYKYSDMK